MSHSAMSIAEIARVKMPSGPAPPAASHSLSVTASTCSGSSPTVSSQRLSTAVRRAGVSAAPKNVMPMPCTPSSVSSSSVTNSRVPGWSTPTMRGLTSGASRTRVVQLLTFM